MGSLNVQGATSVISKNLYTYINMFSGRQKQSQAKRFLSFRHIFLHITFLQHTQRQSKAKQSDFGNSGPNMGLYEQSKKQSKAKQSKAISGIRDKIWSCMSKAKQSKAISVTSTHLYTYSYNSSCSCVMHHVY